MSIGLFDHIRRTDMIAIVIFFWFNGNIKLRPMDDCKEFHIINLEEIEGLAHLEKRLSL
jgi:hypothetical protein